MEEMEKNNPREDANGKEATNTTIVHQIDGPPPINILLGISTTPTTKKILPENTS